MKTITICDDTQTLSDILSASNGIGYIAPLSGTVTEELNGAYEAEFTVATEERRFGELKVGGILKIVDNEGGSPQMFRIYEISMPMNGRVTVKACHITYDLGKVAVTPFSSTGAANLCTDIVTNSVNIGDFSMTTDIVNTASTFTLDVPKYFRECLGGWEGSVLDVFRGEYEYDNLTVKMLARRGADNGVHVSYGKNLTDFRQDENNENVYTAVLGYAVWNGTTYVGNVYHKVVSTNPKIKIVDFSSNYQGNTAPTVLDLTTFSQSYATANDIEVPKVNFDVKFVPLSQTNEYKNIAPLEQVSLGDTVYVDIPKLNVTASARVVKTVWNITKGRYDSVELGETKSTLSSIIADNETAITEVNTTTTTMQGTVNNLVTGLETAEKWIAYHYRLSGNSTVTFNMNSTGYMAVIFAQRSQASTGEIFLIENYTANYTTFGSGNITITQNSSRVFTISNTGGQNVTLMCLGGYFS